MGVWDNLWYGGQYPFASYSLLYYVPAALVGNVPLVFGAVVVSAALFAAIVAEEWGPAAARWPARAFAVLAIGPLFSGTYAYALGIAALLGCLRALQKDRMWLAAATAALTLGFSPLAFVFLCVVLIAVAIARRRLGPRTIAIGAGLAVLACFQVGLGVLFPVGGSYPFRLLGLAAVLGVAGLGAALALRSPRGGALASLFVVWASASVVAYLIPSPLGENLARLRSVAFPLVLLAALLAGFRPRWLATLAVACALAYNVYPYLEAAPQLTDTRAAQASFWQPAIAFLRGHSSPAYRVDVVPTYDNWEAYYLPRAGIPLTRGWYRQIDIGENAVLYGEAMDAAQYRAWLRSMGVRYVLLPSTKLDQEGAHRQAELLESGRSGLVPVLVHPDGVIYELPRATPILTGPGSARVTRLTHDRILGELGAAGTYRLRVHYTPYMEVAAGGVCLAPATDGMTLIEARRPRFVRARGSRGAGVARSLAVSCRAAGLRLTSPRWSRAQPTTEKPLMPSAASSSTST